MPDEAELRTVFDAILPAIEVVETRLGHPPCTNPWAGMADLQYMGNTVVAEWHGCPDDAMTQLGVSLPAPGAKPAK